MASCQQSCIRVHPVLVCHNQRAPSHTRLHPAVHCPVEGRPYPACDALPSLVGSAFEEYETYLSGDGMAGRCPARGGWPTLGTLTVQLMALRTLAPVRCYAPNRAAHCSSGTL